MDTERLRVVEVTVGRLDERVNAQECASDRLTAAVDKLSDALTTVMAKQASHGVYLVIGVGLVALIGQWAIKHWG